jgi:hypothetical protein
MTDISIFKDLASVSQPSHHRVTSDLDTFEVAQSRALSTADVGGLRAAGVEGAAAWGVQRVGHFA